MSKNKEYDKSNLLADRMVRVRRATADFLNKRVNRLSSVAKKAGLLLFGTAAGAICLWLIIASLNGGGKAGLSIDRITAPENTYQMPERLIEVERVQRYKAWLDSLKNDKHGRQKYDSILLHHPGLPDSVDKVLDLYKR